VSNSPHHLDGQALDDSCSLHRITSPASKHRYHALIAGCVKSIVPLGERRDFHCWHEQDVPQRSCHVRYWSKADVSSWHFSDVELETGDVRFAG
jgi:hypothetical protein